MRRVLLAAAFLGLVAGTAGRARAGMIVNFSYSGRGGPDNAGLVATGTGSFSFADGLSTVGLADLTTFAFALDETAPNTPPNTVTFDLAHLTSFSASVGPGPTLTGLALATGPVQGSDQQTWPRELAVSSLGPAGASTRVVILGISIFLTAGDITVDSIGPVAVPEPGTLVLATLGGAGLGGYTRWGRKRARAEHSGVPRGAGKRAQARDLKVR
jgi:hypothetical protein